MPIKVVSNSGPLMVFSKLNILHLLKELYGQVELPASVYRETVESGIRRGFEDAHVLRLFLSQQRWKPVKKINMPFAIQDSKLDEGEKDAIALASEKSALLLMDEERGRELARSINLPVIGSLGVLLEAHAKQLISEEQLRFYFQQIGEREDIWINPVLCRNLLKRRFDP